jgi:hypothetical protein
MKITFENEITVLLRTTLLSHLSSDPCIIVLLVSVLRYGSQSGEATNPDSASVSAKASAPLADGQKRLLRPARLVRHLSRSCRGARAGAPAKQEKNWMSQSLVDRPMRPVSRCLTCGGKINQQIKPFGLLLPW